MSDRFDDWGAPILPPPKPKSVLDHVRDLMKSAVRHRNQIFVCLFIIALWRYISSRPPREPKVDWSRFAYVQYASDTVNLCSSLMIFEALHRLGSRANRVLLYPQDWQIDTSNRFDRNSQLLAQAEHLWKARLKPVALLNATGIAVPGTLETPSGAEVSLTKLRAWQQDEFDRVIYLDSDITMNHHVDELFLLPSTPIAMPRAYQLDKPPEEWPLSTLLILLEPGWLEFDNLMGILDAWRSNPQFQPHDNMELDILNHRFGGSAMILPHRPYILPSSEFRRTQHDSYLGTRHGPERKTSKTRWDARAMLAEAKLVHFHDPPLLKPWYKWPRDGITEIQPQCDGISECPERAIWKDLYDDFRHRKKDLCKILSSASPSWEELKNRTEVPPLDAV